MCTGKRIRPGKELWRTVFELDEPGKGKGVVLVSTISCKISEQLCQISKTDHYL